MSLSVNRVSAYHPAFRGVNEIQTNEETEKKGMSTATKAVLVTAGLALAGWGIYALTKGKGTKALQDAAPPVAKPEEKLPEYLRSMTEIKNKEHREALPKILEDYKEAASKREITSHNIVKKFYDDFDWNQAVTKREDVLRLGAENTTQAVKDIAGGAYKTKHEAKKHLVEVLGHNGLDSKLLKDFKEPV
ncbi:MAG: hypothetical protein LBJ74_03270 [Heliobacteriaceae bacterium]|jgi:hypothetical protein|nr:hypothetical protein [Heliobacteriaceae bacterium]